MLMWIVNQAHSCAPFTPNNLVIWNYNGEVESTLPYNIGHEWKTQFIALENASKLFPSLYGKLWEYYFIDTLRVDVTNYNKWDIVITISDYQNWNYDEYFTVSEMWKISCNNESDFSIEEKQWKIKSFWEEMWQCGSYKPEDALSENELLKKIKEKYKNCDEFKNERNSNIDVITEINQEAENVNTIAVEIPWYSKIINAIYSFIINLF